MIETHKLSNLISLAKKTISQIDNRKIQLVLILISVIYYSFFVNRGLVFLDEGYFLHASERIFLGQIPYKDFSLQYGPTFFYLIAFLFKIFGPSIIIGRIFTVFITTLILGVAFLILNKLKVNLKVAIISFFALLSFGYLLINIPNIMWANVLMAFLLVFTFLYWLPKGEYKHLLLIGVLLALSLSFKQNFGVAFILLYNALLFFGRKDALKQRIKNLLILQATWISLTFSWVYYFFLRDNIAGLLDFVHFSQRFTQAVVFSYPSFSLLSQPTGIFKLLPYYLPFLLVILVVFYALKKKKDFRILAFSLTAVVGFFVSIYPQSDLLHCYPFFGMILISFLLFPLRLRYSNALRILVLIMILIGFYLSILTKSYRYENYYYNYNTYLNLPRTQGILVAKKDNEDIIKLSIFINKVTKKNDYVFAYPYSPLLYFILERSNASKDPLYFLPSWHFYEDKVIINELKEKKVKYIITQANYSFEADLSRFIRKQKMVFAAGQFTVFELVVK